jgi:hypothetical protein
MANNVSEKAFYGTNFQDQNIIPIQKILTQFENYKNKEIVVKAKADKVCAQKGCWMTVKLKDQSVRIKFKNYAFFVPMSLMGKDVYVKGQVSRKLISIEDTKHYLKDEGASAEVIAAVTAPTHEYHFLASGVKLAQ